MVNDILIVMEFTVYWGDKISYTDIHFTFVKYFERNVQGAMGCQPR